MRARVARTEVSQQLQLQSTLFLFWINMIGRIFVLCFNLRNDLVFANELRIAGPPFPLGVHLVLLLLHLPLLHQQHLPVSPDLQCQPVMEEEGEEGERQNAYKWVYLEYILHG